MSLLAGYFYDDKLVAINKSRLGFDDTLRFVVEGSILTTISLLAIPCNIFAICNFSRKQINKKLLVLIYALCCYNFLTVPINVINGRARMLDKFPLGYFGCFISYPFTMSVNNSTCLTFALISYQCRRDLTHRTNDINNNNQSQMSGSGLLKIVILLILINFISLAILSLSFGLYFVDIPSLVKNAPGKSPFDTCPSRREDSLFILEIIISFSNYIIPIVIGVYTLFQNLLTNQHFQIQNLAQFQAQRIFSILNLGIAGFILFHLPFNSVILVSMLKNGKMNLQSTFIFFAFLLIYLNTAINPLCLSFITLKPGNCRALVIRVEMLALENNGRQQVSNGTKGCSCSNNFPSCRNCFSVAETNDDEEE